MRCLISGWLCHVNKMMLYNRGIIFFSKRIGVISAYWFHHSYITSLIMKYLILMILRRVCVLNIFTIWVIRVLGTTNFSKLGFGYQSFQQLGFGYHFAIFYQSTNVDCHIYPIKCVNYQNCPHNLLTLSQTNIPPQITIKTNKT